MTSTPPEAPTAEAPRTETGGPRVTGPRVTGTELRDLSRLRRSSGNRRIAGVAGGIARHLDIDPAIVRVALVVLAFFGGAGLLVYAVCWLIVPSDDATAATVRLDTRSRTVALVLAGALAVLAVLGDTLGGFGFPWPLFVIGAVVLGVLLSRRSDEPLRATYVATTPAGVADPGARAAYRPAPVVARRGGPILFWYAVALIAIGVGLLAMVDLAGTDVPGSAYPALALGISGAALLLGAFWGRAGGLILLGLLSAAATAGTTAFIEVDAGHLDAHPRTASAVESTYRLDAGEIDLDLTDLSDLEALDGRTITLDVDLGRVSVLLPRGLDVTIASDVSLGTRSILGVESDGDSGTVTDLARIAGPAVATTPAITPATTPAVTLDVSVGLGEIDVTREGASR